MKKFDEWLEDNNYSLEIDIQTEGYEDLSDEDKKSVDSAVKKINSEEYEVQDIIKDVPSKLKDIVLAKLRNK